MSCNWSTLTDTDEGQLDDNSLTHHSIEKVIDKLESNSNDIRRRAPFQFTLPILSALYLDINGMGDTGDTEEVNEDIQCYITNLSSNGESEPSRLFSPPAPDWDVSCNQNLRAIIYFSWEEERRVFLVRRTYPYHFDFLSYSHCPAGWGSLGRMLEELDNRADDSEHSIVYTDSDQHPVSEQRLLPYQREINRIGHDSALVLPIKEDNTLRGAFLFCIEHHGPGTFPEDTDSAIEAFQDINENINDALTKHEESIKNSSCNDDGQVNKLPCLWANKADSEGVLIGDLKIKFRKGTPGVDKTYSHAEVKSKTNNLVESLEGYHIYSILDDRDGDYIVDNDNSFNVGLLVAFRDTDDDPRQFVIESMYSVLATLEGVEYSFEWLENKVPIKHEEIRTTVEDNIVENGDIDVGKEHIDITEPDNDISKVARILVVKLIDELCVDRISNCDIGISSMNEVRDVLDMFENTIENNDYACSVYKKSKKQLESKRLDETAFKKTV